MKEKLRLKNQKLKSYTDTRRQVRIWTKKELIKVKVEAKSIVTNLKWYDAPMKN